MSEFLLIHGACHGAWCWRDTIPALEALGHSARAIDLPGHGDDRTPVEAVTLDAYRDAVLAACGPETVLVGHSMGGYAIAAAAAHAPGAMRGLIFVCAYAPVSGMSLADMRRAAPRQPLLPAIRRAADGQSFTIDPAMARDVFYHDCSDEQVAYAVPHLCVQAVLPQETPLHLPPAYDAVPKAYIRCTDDRTIPPEYQITMSAGFPADRVVDMAVSHSPFFADPDGLTRHLARLAGGF